MTGDLTIQQARLVLPDRAVVGDVVVRDGIIAAIGPRLTDVAGEVVDGTGLVVIPGVMDAQVYAGGGLADDIGDVSRAAAAGGITSMIVYPDDSEMDEDPNEAFNRRRDEASDASVVHHGLMVPASLDLDIATLDQAAGAVTDADPSTLSEVLQQAHRLVSVRPRQPERERQRVEMYEGIADVAVHSRLHDVEGATEAVREALVMAHKVGARLHLPEMSAAEQVVLLQEHASDRVTAQVGLANLMLSAETAYGALGNGAVADPPVRGERHRDALWQGLITGAIGLASSQHIPVGHADKQRPYPQTPVGMPGAEWLLPLMLDAVYQERCSLHQVVRWLCEAPAKAFGVPRKGRLEVGFDADLVLVDLNAERAVEGGGHSRAGWSPYVGRTVRGWPVMTVVLGRPVMRGGVVGPAAVGRQLTFRAVDRTSHGHRTSTS